MLAWAKSKGSEGAGPSSPRQAPPEGKTAAEEEERTRRAEAACNTRLVEVRCELEAKRLRLEAELAATAEGRREAAVREWREQQQTERREHREQRLKRRQERRDRRRRFWSAGLAYWRKRQSSLLGQSGTLRVLTALGLPATLALAIYACTQDGAIVIQNGDFVKVADGWEVFGVGLLAAAAAFSVGALLGFVFGIPRRVEAAAAASAAAADEGTPAAKRAAAAAQFAPNTNLEQISDWLTKILVGVGLVQIGQLSGAVEDLGNGLAPGLGSEGFTVAVSTLIAFSIIGFVSAYLYTRLRLQSAFERAAVLQELKDEIDAQGEALALVQKQLSPGDVDRPAQAELEAALKGTTPGIRSQAFYRARDQRRKNWRGRSTAGEDKDYVAPTIGVFDALIACDPEGHYHRTRGERGYALKDQQVADLAAARLGLDQAIALRPAEQASQFGLYEFNRAYCEIKRDPEAKAAAEQVAAVVKDLESALGSLDGREIAEAAIKNEARDGVADDSVSKWLHAHRHGSPDADGLLKRFDL